MSRLHPFDYVFGETADERFGELRTEATRSRRDLTERVEFLRFEPVRRLLADLRTPDAGDSAGAALEEYGALLYVAYRYWAAGRRAFELGREDVTRMLGEDPPDGAPEVPHGACYLRLPAQLFWAQIHPGGPHEPLDGLFVAAGAGGREITVLAVLGLRAERAGFSQITITAPREDVAQAGATVRSPLFAPVMEGGERAGFRSLVSEGELLHLAHLALRAATR